MTPIQHSQLLRIFCNVDYMGFPGQNGGYNNIQHVCDTAEMECGVLKLGREKQVTPRKR